MNKLRAMSLALLCGSWIEIPAIADEVAIEAGKDNTLFSTGTTSNGAGSAIFSGRTGAFRGFVRQRAVLEFDVAGHVPAGSTITGATLTLHLERAGNDVPEYHTLHRVLAEWGEGDSAATGGQGGLATAGDATWLHTFYPDQFWTTEGGDFDPMAGAGQMVPVMEIDPVPVSWGSTPEMVADVQQWLDQPDDNHGWLVMGNETGSNTARKFFSREHSEPDERPVLTIQFELPAPCLGDVDGNGTVDMRDIRLVAHALRDTGGGSEDIDGDGVVTVADLRIVVRNLGPCPELVNACAADLNGDGRVGIEDMLQVLRAFRTVGDVPEDLDGDGVVGVNDFLIVVRTFGPCP